METLCVSAAVSVACLFALLALRLRRQAPGESAIRVLAEQSVGQHGLVLVEVEGRRMLLAKGGGGLQLVSEIAAGSTVAPAISAVAAAAAAKIASETTQPIALLKAEADAPPTLLNTPLFAATASDGSGRVGHALQPLHSAEVSAPVTLLDPPASSLYAPADAVTDAYEDYLARRNAESTQPFSFEIRQPAARP